MPDTFEKDLELLIRSRHPIIFVDTDEKDRAEGLLSLIAERLKLPFYTWTRTKGLRESFQLATSRETIEPMAALQEIEYMQRSGIYNFQGLGHDLEDRTLATKLRDAAMQFRRRDGSIIITGESCDIPSTLQPLSSTLRMPPPALEEYRQLIQHIYRDLSQRMAIEVVLTRAELTQLLNNLKGLPLLEAERILTKAMVEDGRLDVNDIRKVIDAKKNVIEREGLLEYYPLEESIEDIAGLEGLKKWLSRRRAIIVNPEKARDFGLTFPKGILLLGVQGCGKSLCAKAVAADWGLPLLRMDAAGLYNKYIGESEKNFDRAMRTAEKMAPVVLWIDEIEKAFASGSNDGGVSVRVLGTFLSWLQERNGDVFVIATANDVTGLPPELIRKGRFDEIFFVDLPKAEARRAILEIHLRKRKRNPQTFDLHALVNASEGFSGAELEQAVVSGLYTAFADGTDLNQEILLEELRQTRPLSQTMAENIGHLRAWAQERTVSAD